MICHCVLSCLAACATAPSPCGYMMVPKVWPASIFYKPALFIKETSQLKRLYSLWMWSTTQSWPLGEKSAVYSCSGISLMNLPIHHWLGKNQPTKVGKPVFQISLPSLYPQCKVTAALSPHSMQTLKWVYCWRSQALDWDLVGHKV